MENSPTNPIYIFIFFLARCLVPLLILLGISALLRRFGFIRENPQPPRPPNNHPDTLATRDSHGG
jgi:hypothetical protein